MKITCDGKVLETSCTGCQCHEMAMTFGLTDGCCKECGCPKTAEAFNRLYARRPA